MKKRYLSLLIISVVLSEACQQDKSPAKEVQTVQNNVETLEDAIHWFVIGDFGRNGQAGQQETADQMQVTSLQLEPEFIITTGDNFYPNGVASVDDPYWITSFENVYNGYNLFVPWYAVLGNHDYRGSYQAEIDYTNVSQRWTMPDQYYVKDVEDDGITIKFVFIDTNPFEDGYYEELKYKTVWSQDSTKQLLWMDSVLSDNSSDWKIVVGHHPLYSGGKRLEETGDVRGHLEKTLKKHEVDVYFAGHEHDLQHIKNPNYKTHHVVSGAGSDIRPTGEMDYTVFARSVNGFVTGSATREKLLIQFIDVNGNAIHKFSIEK